MGQRDDVFWAEFLGIEPREWSTPGTSYEAQVGLRGYQGFWCFRRNERVVISAPPRWVDPLRQMFSGWAPQRLLEPVALQTALGPASSARSGQHFRGVWRRSAS